MTARKKRKMVPHLIGEVRTGVSKTVSAQSAVRVLQVFADGRSAHAAAPSVVPAPGCHVVVYDVESWERQTGQQVTLPEVAS